MSARGRVLAPGRCAGASLFELLMVTMVIGTTAAALLERLLYYQEVAEKAHVEYTIRMLHSGLRMQVATLMIDGRLQQAPHLAGQNPLDWLERKPANYLGELSPSDVDELEPGNWYFDPKRGVLTYLVKHDAHFSPTGGRADRIEVRAVTAESSTGANVRLELLAPYAWEP